jgi:uncharacterized protein (DUF2252 family)
MKAKKLGIPQLEERQLVLCERRHLKMAGSAHAYVRGNALKFYEWLEAAANGVMPEGPPVWICGDCHVGNLGPLANAKGRIDIQIRELDQTVNDLIRISLSLATTASGSDLPGVMTAKMIEAMMEGYEQALEGEVVDQDEKPESVRIVMKRAVGRTWKNLARERLEDTTPTIPLGSTFWPPPKRKHKKSGSFSLRISSADSSPRCIPETVMPRSSSSMLPIGSKDAAR